MKNRIINGAMVIDQRNAGASVTPASVTSTFITDRWGIYPSQASKLTAQQNAGSVTPPAGFNNYLGVTSSSAYSVTSTDVFTLYQSIEGLNCTDLGWGTANAQTVTLSFWVRSSLTGAFGGYISNSAQNRTYPFSYTISSANTWTSISVTVAGDTTGTWLRTSGIGIQIGFSLGVGSSLTGTANTWSGSTFYAPTGSVNLVGTSGATFYITGVQLEVGSSATGFEYRQYGQELALCQRYYETLTFGTYPNFPVFGDYQVSNAGYGSITWHTTKRAEPTVTKVSGTWTLGTPSIAPSVDGCFFYSSPATAFYLTGTAGQVAISASSEL